MMYKPVVLIVLDGWGLSSNRQGNAISNSRKPSVDKLDQYYPSTTLQASGISVGIPWGESGNSEVGHMTIGAGKIIYQNLPRITLSVQDGSFFQNEAFLEGMENVKKNNSSLHLMGLVGEGAVHSYSEHLHALIEMASIHKIERLYLHLITDGRDSSPTCGTKIIKFLQDKLRMKGIGKIASVCGRNWTMDRNNNWSRVEKGYNLMTQGQGEQITDPIKYLQDSYAKGVTDEYIEPGVVTENGKPVALVQDGDTMIFFNFREDRARQITRAFTLPEFDGFKREKRLQLNFVTMTEYEKDLPVSVAFPPEEIKNGLGEILSQNRKKQLRIAETEKYAHVTYFFNGGKEEPWPGEDRVLIPSPSVSKFDQAPEMSADKITQKVIEALELEKYDFILINYANADMVGHTGNEEATIRAVETVDNNLATLIPAVLKIGGCLLITADHGNAEELQNLRTGEINTEHSSNPVPLWFVAPDNHHEERKTDTGKEFNPGGLLSDLAPTVLGIMRIDQPKEMNGESLLPLLK
ncbi:MAG: 2,3-bisphosphoglycerate-independent phosphoglycerate mutase [Candidatus Moranbacteria bacterium]|nr:2,3-bisphosphoglycerate-independent phosphoglycerate mutase [Candidatus Moranbacteria bacterium]